MFHRGLLRASLQLRPHACLFCSPQTRFLSASAPPPDEKGSGAERSSSTLHDAAEKQDASGEAQPAYGKARRRERGVQQTPPGTVKIVKILSKTVRRVQSSSNHPVGPSPVGQGKDEPREEVPPEEEKSHKEEEPPEEEKSPKEENPPEEEKSSKEENPPGGEKSPKEENPPEEEKSPKMAMSEKKQGKSHSIKAALLAKKKEESHKIKVALLEKKRQKQLSQRTLTENIPMQKLSPNKFTFEPILHSMPPIPRLSHGLDRVLFNPGVYHLQDPRSRVYNFDPYLEKIIPVAEFDFDALSEYKTSSKDEELLAMTRKLKAKFTGSTSSLSGVLQHFHFMLSDFRDLNHNMLSREYPDSSNKFSRISQAPSAIFLRRKPGLYAVDADKSFDEPNIMSWMGHSMEKLLTTSRPEFERYRRSTPEAAPDEKESGKCFHYSKMGNFLVRSQLDAHDNRLPGTGVFDLKTRAVVSIRMDHTEYETGSGYQIRFDQGEWESYEREFYDMTRATMLKYSLQVRMGRMDGIFVAYHNIERLFGFQYLSLPDMDNVLHGQTDTCLGDQEFKASLHLLDIVLQRATEKFPDTSLRLHFEARETTHPTDLPLMTIFAEPVTEEMADQIQNAKIETTKEFERDVIGIKRDDPVVQVGWHDIHGRVDDEVVEDDANDTQTPESAAKERRRSEGSQNPFEENQMCGNEVETEKFSPRGPLMGWTLVIRNRVNGEYVKRPEQLGPMDNWLIEYHIQEILEDFRWKPYLKMQRRRKNLVGLDKEEQTKSLQTYRELIREFSYAGRRWRQMQDRIDARIGRRVFRPLGPGAKELLRRESGA